MLPAEKNSTVPRPPRPWSVTASKVSLMRPVMDEPTLSMSAMLFEMTSAPFASCAGNPAAWLSASRPASHRYISE